MTLITVQRDKVTPASVSSTISLDGVIFCDGLEPGADPVIPGHPTIPAGKYRVQLTYSPHLGYVCPEVTNVPGRLYIRIHKANFVSQLLGCLAVGATRSLMLAQNEWAVWSSQVAFDALMAKLEPISADGGEIWVEYLDPVPQTPAGTAVVAPVAGS